MTQDELKALVARAAIEYVQPGTIVGVGTGSTANCFIDELAKIKDRIAGAVSSSAKSTERLLSHGVKVLDSATVERLPIYVDGADEIDHKGYMIKGGGAALTREKIVADLADQFICIADESKLVDVLGKFPSAARRACEPAWSPTTARPFSTSRGCGSPIRLHSKPRSTNGRAL